MFRRIIWNDFIKSRTVSIIMLLFIAAAAALIALAVTLGLQLAGSIDALMTQAKTPHFLQMHAGTIDTKRLEQFALHYPGVEDFQVLEFLNIDGAEIAVGEDTLAGSVQDNGLSMQSNAFDYLLDLEGNVIHPADGQIYVPIAYGKDGMIKTGEQMGIAGKSFVVAGFLRDSQMNSPLASSKRFLVSENDYAAVKSMGNVEYLIEFRLKSLSNLNALESAYIGAGLESNGPTVTYPLFRMMNAMSDGLMIAVLLLISALAVLIACLCIRFTLLAQIEEDTREIGVMKAIGMRISDMKKLYLGKYAAVTAAGSILGWALSLALEQHTLKGIRLAMGDSGGAASARVWGGAAVFLVFFTVMLYVNGALNRFKKIPAAQAIRFGSVLEKSAGIKKMPLSKNRTLNTNFLLGLKEVICRKRIYTTMLCVVMASTFIMLVPQNLYSTISSPSFSTYMGIGKADMLIRISQPDRMTDKIATVIQALENDENVAKYAVHTTKRFDIQSSNAVKESIRIDLGDHFMFPVYYVKGDAPRTESEIALSSINAEELGKQIGDTLTLVQKNHVKTLTVTGIYSDITNGGKTAKAIFTDNGSNVMWYTSYVKLKDSSRNTASAEQYARQFSFAKVADVDKYISQTFGATIESIKNVAAASLLAALLMTVLVTLLMMKMLIARERRSIAVMKALGFTSRDITAQFLSRFLLVLLTGMLAGTILANTVGERLAGAVIASFGASSFQFVMNPFLAYLLYPLAMGCAVIFAVWLGTSGVRNIQVSSHIKE